MDRPDYHADVAALRTGNDITGDIWKLERSQVFEESGDPAWEAFVADDWNQVLAIFEEERESLREEIRAFERSGLRLRRLRVVEHPPTPYLRWEMHSHRIFVDCGHEIGVLGADRLREWESDNPVPELMVYGDKVIYQIRYNERWEPAGAKRIDDLELARATAALVSDLYAQAEPLADYFDREIAPLAPVCKEKRA